MKEIKLTRGKFAQVDDSDFEYLNLWRWHLYKSRNTYYAIRLENNKYIRMHRIIMNTPAELTVDHIDHNGLNCQRHNMRNCTHEQNSKNMIQKRGNSNYIGVHFRKDRNKYIAYIEKCSKKMYLGYFDNSIDAARARDYAAKKYYGEFANLNFK